MSMWDGRFGEPADELLTRFNNSLAFDCALIEEDIAVNTAWAKALEKAGILTSRESAAVRRGLGCIRDDHRAGKLRFLDSDEDIHMAIERLLTSRIGAAGEKIHTGRSRNDQSATDTRMFVMNALGRITGETVNLQKVLLARARTERRTIVPGYTHLQQAQPVLLSHYWLSFLFALEREKVRLANARDASDEMPLGSGALAGCGFAVDRNALARELGFSRISVNSMDAVSARDFVLEALAALASLGILLSRYAEDLAIWSSREFGFVRLSDAWATGSSMMPQKKNPDALELIRGKAGRLIGNHAGFAATLKGVALTYSKDLQEDKEPLFDSLAQAGMMVRVFAGVLSTLTVDTEKIGSALDPLLLATDYADYLVRKGIPFRGAHKIIGKIVAYCIEKNLSFDKLPLEKLKTFSGVFEGDIRRRVSMKNALTHREITGGTGPASVRNQIRRAKKLIGK